jgi:hypothetical protein
MSRKNTLDIFLRFLPGLLVAMCLFTVCLPVSTHAVGITQAEADRTYRETNYVLWYDHSCQQQGGSSSTAMLPGGNNVEKMLNYLQSKGFSLEQATGIVGAMQAESGENLDPNALNPGSGAYGIAQWLGGRKSNLERYGGGSGDFDKQAQFLGWEIGIGDPWEGKADGGETASRDAVKATNTPEAAALAWENAFERSGGAALDSRQSNARKLYDQYKGSAGATAPMGNSKNTSGCGSSVTGNVNADGYAWPIALTKADQDGNWPCSGSCHHDGTTAFDLAKKARDDSTEGTPTIAIYNGTIQSFNNSYAGQSGCQAFQLVGDDGWWYWYGHQQASSVQDGAKVTAGQQISTVGRRDCTGNGSYPHLHIDRGSPKGHFGGDPCCRDPEFTPLMNKLYEELGGGGGSPRDL